MEANSWQRFKTFCLALRWVDALPMFFTISLITVFVIIGNNQHLLNSLVLGSIVAAIVDINNNFGSRLKQYLFALLSFSISTLLVYITSFSWLALSLTFASYSFIWLMLASISKEIEKLSLAALLFYSYSIFVFFVLDPASDASNYKYLLFILIGSLLYMSFSLLIYAIYPNRASHIYLSKIYRSLGRLLLAKSDFFDPDQIDNIELLREKYNQIRQELNSELEEAKQVFLKRMGRNLNYNAALLKYYYVSESLSQSLDLYYMDYARLSKYFKHHNLLFRFQRIYRSIARDATTIAEDIETFRKTSSNDKLDQSLEKLKSSLDKFQAKVDSLQSHSLEIFEVNKLYRDTADIVAKLNKVRDLSSKEMSQVESFDNNPIIENYKHKINATAWHLMLNNKIGVFLGNFTIRSAVFRNAIRVSTVILVISNLYYFTNLDFTIWAVMAGVLVSKSDYIVTKKTMRWRIIGALLGNLIAGLVILAHPDTYSLYAILIIGITLYAYCRLNNYQAYAIGLITIVVLTSIEIYSRNLTIELVASKLFGNLSGILIAFVATIWLLPSWNHEDLSQVIKKSYRSLASYFSDLSKSALKSTQEHNTIATINNNLPISYHKYYEVYNNNLKLHSSVKLMALDPKHYSSMIKECSKFTLANDNLLHMINIMSYLLNDFKQGDSARGTILLNHLNNLSRFFLHFNSMSEEEYTSSLQSILFHYCYVNQKFSDQKDFELNLTAELYQLYMLENKLYLIANQMLAYRSLYYKAIVVTEPTQQ